MADIIQFPQRGQAETLRFHEKHVFGEIGGLRLSLVQEEGKEDSPLFLILIEDIESFLPLQFFEPTDEGIAMAKLAGDVALRVLAAAHANWAD